MAEDHRQKFRDSLEPLETMSVELMVDGFVANSGHKMPLDCCVFECSWNPSAELALKPQATATASLRGLALY